MVILRHFFKKKLLINAGLFLTTFFVILICIEVILFTFTNLKKKEEKIWVKIGSSPGNCYTSDKHHYFPLTIHDSLNHRTLHCIQYDVLKRQKGFFPERKIQFALIGDSFVFGEGIKEEDTLAYLLGEKFREINFRNYGTSGASVLDVYHILLQLIKKGNPKGIIYFYNLNDVLMSKEIESQQKYIIDFQNIRWFNVKKDSHFFTKLWSQSTLYTLFERGLILKKESEATIQNYWDMYFDSKNKKELEQTLSLLRKMNEIAQSKQIKFSIIIYPLLYKDMRGGYPFKSIHDFLANFCRQNGLTCVDAYPAFHPYRSLKPFTVHPVDYHPNRAANELVVNYLNN